MNSENSRELPPDLKAILDDLEKSTQEAWRIISGLSDAQANWQPRESAWSIAQCLDHLGRANSMYAAALRAAVQDARAAKIPRGGPIRPGWFSRYFIRTIGPPPKTKLRAPKKIVPASRANKDEVLQAFLRSQEDVRTVAQEGAGLDLNRIRFHNPFMAALHFTVGTGLLIVAAHDRRHLWQADQVRQSAQFPAA